MIPELEQAAGALSGARRAVALTGAGISVESGIPPFRGKGGLWEKLDPMKYAHIDAFVQNPLEVWQVLFMGLKTVLEKAAPNDGHKGLFELERLGVLQAVITQNIDGLHQRAGNRDVIEFHGTFNRQRCMACNATMASESVVLDPLPPRCRCGGFLRPDVVMFGEIIDPDLLQRSQLLAATCDVMLVVGTSATVQPAAYLPVIAKRHGATIIEVNPEPTPLTGQISDVSLLGQAGSLINHIVSAVTALKSAIA